MGKQIVGQADSVAGARQRKLLRSVVGQGVRYLVLRGRSGVGVDRKKER